MKGLICNTDQVRGILDGTVTAFRVPMKPQPGEFPASGSTFLELPYQPGDILYVREAWAIAQPTDSTPSGKSYDPWYVYKADGASTEELEREYGYLYEFRWRSPATMPRGAARLFLRVVDVKVERVQEISHDDAFAEGVDIDDVYRDQECGYPTAPMVYARMWDRRYPKYPYESNPWTAWGAFERSKGEG
jgi:hypothetical protein